MAAVSTPFSPQLRIEFKSEGEGRGVGDVERGEVVERDSQVLVFECRRRR